MRQEKLHRLWYETFRGKAVTLPYLFKVERIEDQQPRMLPNQDICTSHSLCLALVLANPLACFLTSSGPFLRVNLSKRPLLTTLSKIAVLTPSFSRSLLSFIFLYGICHHLVLHICIQVISHLQSTRIQAPQGLGFCSPGCPVARNVSSSEQAFNKDLLNEQTLLSMQF